LSKITLLDFGSDYSAIQRLNANNDLIEAEFENTLSRDGSGPNQMEAVLDMNSHKIINLATPTNPNDAARFADVQANAITITNNTTIIIKDWFTQPAKDILATPPGSPSGTDRYLVALSATGAWSGKSGLVAEWDATLATPAWTFSVTPKQGQKVYVESKRKNYIYRNTWWNKVQCETVDAVYQDFRDVPNGTVANGLILASGHTLNVQGPGITSTISGGKYIATDNSYLTVLYPYKNFRMAMEYMWVTGDTGAVVLAAGTLVGGAIISKMIHTEYLYQGYGDMSIWGGPRQTVVGGVPIGYLATAGIQYHFRGSDARLPVHGYDQLQYAEMYVNGCNVKCHGDYGVYQDVYTDDMISTSVGNDESGNLGYLYWQTGGILSPLLPDIYSLLAEPLPATEDLPDPKYIPSNSLAPQMKSKGLTYGGGAQEVCRFTPNNYTNYAFTVDANIATSGPIPGYAQETHRYVVNVCDYNNTIVVSTQAVTSALATSVGAGVAAVSNTFTVGISGLDVIFYGNPARTGTDASAYTPIVTYTINPITSYGSFV
jgi:hypothetical protein